jgi:ACS family D-galactonate transporter-like MFS transporter
LAEIPFDKRSRNALATILPDIENVRRSPLPPATANENSRHSHLINRVVALLALSILINYIDRGSLAIAAPLLKGELGLSDWQLGKLLASFFVSYSLFLPLSGWMVDRFDVKWVMASGFFLWSAATAVTGISRGFAALLAARLLLGLGETVAYPSSSKVLAQYVPEVHRGFANALIVSGVGLGPALGAYFGAMLVASFGWRPFFLVLGFGSMLWLIPWLKWMPRKGSVTAISTVGDSSAEFAEILMQRSLWGTCGGLFGVNYVLYFEITWLPSYLTRERHFSLETMAKIVGLGYLCYAVASVFSGWISDRWIAAGATPTLVRKTFTGVGVGSAGILLLGCVLAGPTLSVILLLAACACGGISGSNVWPITQTLAGPKTAGRWTGLQNFFGNLAGVLGPALTGFVVGRTGRFFLAFVIMAVVSLLAALSWICVVGPVKQIAWTQRSAAPDALS